MVFSGQGFWRGFGRLGVIVRESYSFFGFVWNEWSY